MPYFINLIFYKMLNTITDAPSAPMTNNFATALVGCMLTNDKRLFQNLHKQMVQYGEILMETEFMNELSERKRYRETMQMLDELQISTINYNEQQLDQQFVDVLVALGFKKESEASND